MAVTIRSLDGGLGALEVGTGVMEGLQLLRAEAEFLGGGHGRTLRYWLTDFTCVVDSRTTSEQVLELAEAQAARVPEIPDLLVALVVRLDVSFGMVRMWQLRHDARGTGWETRLFRDRIEAEDWLRRRMREKYDIEITFA